MLLWEPSHMGAADQCMCRTRKCKNAVTYFFGLLTMMMRSTGGWRMCFDFLTVLLSPLMSTFRSRKVWLCCCWWSLLCGRHITSTSRYTFSSSNHNINKSSYGLCFWAPDPLIDRFFYNLSIKGSETKKQRPHKLLWMLWFDEKSISILPT